MAQRCSSSPCPAPSCCNHAVLLQSCQWPGWGRMVLQGNASNGRCSCISSLQTMSLLPVVLWASQLCQPQQVPNSLLSKSQQSCQQWPWTMVQKGPALTHPTELHQLSHMTGFMAAHIRVRTCPHFWQPSTPHGKPGIWSAPAVESPCTACLPVSVFCSRCGPTNAHPIPPLPCPWDMDNPPCTHGQDGALQPQPKLGSNPDAQWVSATVSWAVPCIKPTYN